MNRYIIDRDEYYVRIAQIFKGRLENIWIEEIDNNPKVGDIYVGRVEKVLSKNNFAFINIGASRNAFVGLNSENRYIKSGDFIIVEVTKEEVEDKGAVVTEKFNIPGAYCVLSAKDNKINFSRNYKGMITEKDIKNILDINKFGLVIRTAANEITLNELKEEVKQLENIYIDIVTRGEYSSTPGLLYRGNELVTKTLKKVFNEQCEIVVNSNIDYKNIKKFIEEYKLDLINVKLYSECKGIFKAFEIESEILGILEKKVKLAGGGDLLINKSAAIASIDVNSGSSNIGKNKEDMILGTNIEAAKECARQIRLRNLSGIIIVDFINMRKFENNKKLKLEFEKEMEKDLNKSTVYNTTELNLMQVTRRRQGNDIYSILLEKEEGKYYSIERVKFKYLMKLIRDEIREEYENNIRLFKISVNSAYERENIEKIKETIQKNFNEKIKIKLEFENKIDLVEVKAIKFLSRF